MFCNDQDSPGSVPVILLSLLRLGQLQSTSPFVSLMPGVQQLSPPSSAASLAKHQSDRQTLPQGSHHKGLCRTWACHFLECKNKSNIGHTNFRPVYVRDPHPTPPWILRRSRLESSGQRLVSLNIQIKGIEEIKTR